MPLPLRIILGLRHGVYVPVGDASDFDSGPCVELSYTLMLNENLGIEAGIGFYRINYGFGPLDLQASGMPILATLKYIISAGEFLNLYGGAGLGMHRITGKVSLYGVGVSESENKFGFHLVGGLDYLIFDNVSLGTEAKYYKTSELDGMEASVDGISISLVFRYYL